MSVLLAGQYWVLHLAGGILVVSMALLMWRLLVGPSRPDRAVAMDALTMIGVAGVTVLALITRQQVLLDVAVILAIVSFLGSAAFALLFRGAHSSDEQLGPQRHEDDR